jgi:hypothetical protein
LTENSPALIFVSAKIMDIHMVKGLLDSEGIKAFVFDDNILRVDPFLTQAVGGIKLFVRLQDLKKASTILRKHLKIKGAPPYSGSLGPFNRSAMMQNVPDPVHSVELEVGPSPDTKPSSNQFSQSDWVLALFVVGVMVVGACALLGW